ncbi:ImmA/IrrE family metallo-endopeptidase [Shewanella sp. SG44-2]|uniref:ImmA/IrrE family metallo-endopeptidase n=1 Tax=Shewanella sp. SG44-2 TaxID=2760962 RepID=UPI0016034985|nr:ImmA/IrrE family metallo-endopeptidase [Shewanella sp. SG44-2]MBB1428227.1 ImmA/IrrE family metallo-endopeptidase [Shewanella sp. SG44-2]
MRTVIVQNYAKRLHAKYKLTLPVDLDELARKYATLKYMTIPMRIDGICADLKSSVKKTRIYVNSEMPVKRQRFTLAHEIGHVIIPWHTGTIFDLTTITQNDSSVDYWEMEQEANSFATELLMPSNWINVLTEGDLTNLSRIHKTVVDTAGVSDIAACLRLIQFLPPGYVFVAVDQRNYVQYSGRSQGTVAPALSNGDLFNIKKHYSYCDKISHVETMSGAFYWFQLPAEIELPENNNDCDWRTILESIFDDLILEMPAQVKLTQQLNGVLGFANSIVKRGNQTKENLYSACIQRLERKENLFPLTDHPAFSAFLVAKINDLFAKNLDGK